jgi:membrane-associated phospholipid phosphatase
LNKTSNNSFKNNWKTFWSEKTFKFQLPVTIVLLFLTLHFFAQLLVFIEQRQGVVINDPILNLFNPVRLDWIIFSLIYISILTGLLFLLKYPQYFLIAIQTYILMNLFRMISMYVIPLDPPLGTLDLNDPLIFVVGTGTPITKDLFFSGHTATMFLLSLTAVNKKLKIIFLISTFLVGFLVILQKAHYTIDVIAAPFYAYCSYKIIYSLQKKLMPETFTGK